MAIISLINYSSLENNLRLEAEYYQPKYLAIEQKLKKMNAVKIRYYTSKITDGTHFTPHYVDSGVKFYSALNVKENIFDQDDKFKYITHKTHALLYKRCTPAPEDILIRKVGVGPRWSAVIPKTTKEEFSIFVSLALLKVRKEKISPYYLSTFINSFYGQAQLLRIQKGMSQPDLHLEDIAELKIPRFDSRYESEIENLILKGLKYRQSAQSLYIQAQDLLERELGLDKFIFDKPLSYEAKLSEVVGNNRSDAEYYHAKYKPLLNLINSFRTGCLPLTKMINEIMPNIDLRKETGEFDYIEIGDIAISDGSYTSNRIQVKDLPANAKIKLHGGELVISQVRPTRGAIAIISDDLKYQTLCSGAFFTCTVNDAVYREIIWLYIRRIKGLFEKFCGGTSYPTIDSHYIKKIPVPLFGRELAERISKLIIESKKAKTESQYLLEKAKCRVEELIEQAVQ